MNSEFNKIIEKFEGNVSTITLVQAAGGWLKKEIDLLMLKQKVSVENKNDNPGESKVIGFLFDKIFTDFTFRWKTPLTIAELIKEITSIAPVQDWFVSRLSTLALIPMFDNIGLIYGTLNRTQIFPTMFYKDQTNELQFPEAFVQEFNNAYVELSEEAKIDNQWLILFVFSLVSFKVLGYEADYLTKTVNV